LKGFVDDWEGEERELKSNLAVAYFKETVTILVWRN
jgi:hypothetical protein